MAVADPVRELREIIRRRFVVEATRTDLQIRLCIGLESGETIKVSRNVTKLVQDLATRNELLDDVNLRLGCNHVQQINDIGMIE
jgi:hypothetical protein